MATPGSQLAAACLQPEAQQQIGQGAFWTSQSLGQPLSLPNA